MYFHKHKNTNCTDCYCCNTGLLGCKISLVSKNKYFILFLLLILLHHSTLYSGFIAYKLKTINN